MIKAAGMQAVSLDLSLLRRDEEDGLAEIVEAGLGILAGAVPAAAVVHFLGLVPRMHRPTLNALQSEPRPLDN